MFYYHTYIYVLLFFRRKSYIVGEEPSNTTLQTNVDSVHHVSIHNTNTMKQFGGHFTNATELTLSDKFEVPRDSLVINLNRIWNI
jgi:hypothetical protein